MDVSVHQAWVSEFIAADFGLPIAHENQHFEPQAGAAYFEIRLMANDVTPYSLADSDETDGVFRVILRHAQGEGAIAPKETLGEVAQAFRIGRRLSYSGVTVTVTGHRVQPGAAEDGWFVLLLDIQYRAFNKRNSQ